MMELIEANWPLLLVALLIGLIVAWFLFAANRRTGVTTDRRDVLDEDGTKAGRNQALIDSAPAARRDTPLAQEPVTRPASAAATAPPTKAAQREIVEPRDVPVRPVTPVAGAGLASPGSAAEAVASEASETPVGQSEPVTGEEISTQPAPAPEPTSEESATQEAADEIAPMPDPDAADDLTRIKGLGPKLNAALAVLGVTRFDQIASWDDAEIDRVDAQLGRFAGRIRRDDWVEQARLLAANDMGSYQDRFGRL
ncbi:hypothetical protein G7A66_07095 [Altererythrobacter sp. SALINAS58]|uniref:hypothetical protein n=1 Tax=Alteripontixanthobacter muriae TaxID=2705546 RepID=UPI00157563EE|nr:hypothetical protein [Alteripontixanthobacter muriae]NTZ42856.1 hypothetical protein [Alteripontixanthobacter muriae]